MERTEEQKKALASLRDYILEGDRRVAMNGYLCNLVTEGNPWRGACISVEAHRAPSREGPSWCGTAACVQGWFWFWDGAESRTILPRHVTNRMKDVMGLSEQEHDLLTRPPGWQDQELACREDNPQRVAAVLNRLIAGKSIPKDWYWGECVCQA